MNVIHHDVWPGKGVFTLGTPSVCSAVRALQNEPILSGRHHLSIFFLVSELSAEQTLVVLRRE
jgi:hypothetical protein